MQLENTMIGDSARVLSACVDDETAEKYASRAIKKGTIDEIIFQTTKVRIRLILELMARGGMRIGEVLKLRLGDLQDRNCSCEYPKAAGNTSLCSSRKKWPTGYANTRYRCAKRRVIGNIRYFKDKNQHISILS
jgi:integrase